MKKAQTEIIGLVIIVILVILGITFVAKFMLSNEPVKYKEEFTQSELASNMLNTFLQTTSTCESFSMTELLQDCVENKMIFCDTSEGTKDSCDYVEQEARTIFDATLEKWNMGYEFKVFHEEENPIFTLGEPCFVNKKSKLSIIPTSSGALSARLDICSK